MEYKKRERDTLHNEAKELIKSHPSGTAGILQRYLDIGYNRASVILETLAEENYITLVQGDYELKNVSEKAISKNKIKKDPFEIIIFLLMTPLCSSISQWITIPLAFLQSILILVLLIILFNPSSTTTAIRVPLSGSGIIAAILSLGIVRLLLEFVYNNLLLVILVLIGFYVYAFATKRPPKFKWMDEEYGSNEKK